MELAPNNSLVENISHSLHEYKTKSSSIINLPSGVPGDDNPPRTTSNYQAPHLRARDDATGMQKIHFRVQINSSFCY